MDVGKLIHLGGRSIEPSAETLEIALALSVATGRGFVWDAPRLPTSAVRLFGVLCGARIVEEREIRFEPEAVRDGPHRWEVGEEVPLLRLLRAAAIPLALSGRVAELRATGVTHAPGSETFEVSRSTWVHLMRKAGLDLGLHLELAGFAPRGGGEVRLACGSPPRALEPFAPGSRGELEALHIVSAASSLPSHVQQRQAARARSGVAIAGIDPDVQLLKLKAAGSGSTVAITGVFGGTPVTVSAVSARGRSVEWVGEVAASEFRALLTANGILPPSLLPSLMLAAALARGDARLPCYRLPRAVSSHAELVRAFTGRAAIVVGKPGQPGEVRIEDEVASPVSETPY